jgi:Uncharacterized protein conserved in bacteria (DUF2188)
MADVTYEIVEHDGGWAYRLGDVYSETFPTRDQAVQEMPRDTEAIQYQDADGRWHEELARGNDIPQTQVVRST